MQSGYVSLATTVGKTALGLSDTKNTSVTTYIVCYNTLYKTEMEIISVFLRILKLELRHGMASKAVNQYSESGVQNLVPSLA